MSYREWEPWKIEGRKAQRKGRGGKGGRSKANKNVWEGKTGRKEGWKRGRK